MPAILIAGNWFRCDLWAAVTTAGLSRTCC